MIELVRDAVATSLLQLIPDEGDPVREAVAAQIERESVQAQAAVVRNAIAAIDQSLEKRFQFSVSFAGELVKVFTVNGDVVRKQPKDGGLGCQDFTMGMNGWAAREPMYHAIDWCLDDEVCLHNLLSAASFLVVLVHEVTERWAMKWLKLSYEDAHDLVANPCENITRDYLNKAGFEEAA